MKIAIAGAGLIGRLLAFQLLQQGNYAITLYDQDSTTGTNSAAITAAGMLAPYLELEKSVSAIAAMGIQSLLAWPNILAALNTDIYFRHQGSLILAHQQDQADLQHYLRKISQQISTPIFRAVVPQEIEPELTLLSAGYYFPDEGQIDSQALMHSLAQYLKDKLTWHTSTIVTHVAPYLIHCQQPHHYDLVFDCRGLGAKSNFTDLRAIRGEVLWLFAPDVNLQRPIRLVHPRYHIYIVPRPNHIYILGASEIEAEDYSPISVRTTLELLSAAYSIHKGFIEARVVHMATQCRPTLPDHLPKIKYCDGLIAINGLYRHGFLLAPSLVTDVINYMQAGLAKVQYQQWWNTYYD